MTQGHPGKASASPDYIKGHYMLLKSPELTENQMARKSNTKEIKNKHSSRPVAGAEMGTRGGEDSSCLGATETGGVWDERGRQSDH